MKRIAIRAVSALTTLLLCALLLAEPALAAEDLVFFSSNYKAEEIASKKLFARVLAEQLKTSLPKGTSCFRDVNFRNAYSKYICPLATQGIFTGGKHTKFNGNEPLEYRFAIRSLCKAYQWSPKTSYDTCRAKAMEMGLFAAPLSTSFEDEAALKIGELDLIFQRLQKTPTSVSTVKRPSTPSTTKGTIEEKPIDVSTAGIFPPNLPQKRVTPVSFTPVPEIPVQESFFQGITLDRPFPNHMILHEVYFVEGRLDNPALEDILIFICEQKNCSNSKNILGKVNSSRFRVPLYFDQPGNFEIGMVPGRGGTSKIVGFSVLPVTDGSAGGVPPTNLQADYAKGESFFSWSGVAKVTELIIFQEDQRVDYIFRQPITRYAPAPQDFVNFHEGEASWLVVQDGAPSTTKRMQMARHRYREIDEESITVNHLAELFPGVATLTFQGIAKTDLAGEAAVTQPNGTVTEISFSDEDVPKNTPVAVNVPLDRAGTYIFEINNTEGLAVINVPIYVNVGLPLLPDFFDLNEPVLDPNASLGNVQTLRLTMLGFINKERRNHGMAEVTLNDTLSATAQAHSEDMKLRNFFAHVNPDGKSPDDRRRSAGISTPIRENLARSASLQFAHEGLMRSPVHRDAILDAAMTRVGIGVAKDTEGYFYITEHFAPNPVTIGDLHVLQGQLFEEARSHREQRGLPTLTTQTMVEGVATEWSQRMINEKFFGLTAPNGETLLNELRKRGIFTSIQIHALQASSADQLLGKIKTQEGLQNAANRNIGIGLAITPLGEVFMTVVYTPEA